ncbi:MAG TPA: hypothetical protein PLC98_18465 [Anaerolineales bacterium]|nr:hypothetical protein [Anaerolineales bacterium]
MATQSVTADKAVEKAAGYVSAADRVMNAAMIASGIGSAVLGLMVVGAEVNTGLKAFLTWDKGVGPLAGKVGIAIIAYVISWVALHVTFQKQSPKLMTALWITVGLLIVGVALTFPPIYMGIASAIAPH